MIGSPLTDAELADARRRADPVADAIVSDFVLSRGIVDPQYLVQRLIAEHRTLPESEQIPSVRSYFQDPVPLPEWAEPELLREGQRFFRTFGVHIASSLFCASLPLSYTAVDGSVVLALTAELVSNTRRRLAQTGEMLLDVMGANDERDAPPFGRRHLCVQSGTRRTAVPRRGPAHAASRREVRRGGAGRADQPGGSPRHAHGVHRCGDRVARAVRRVGRRASSAMRTCASG